MKWTPEQIALFVSMRALGATYDQVALAIGKSRSAVMAFNRDRGRRRAAPAVAKAFRPMTTADASEALREGVLRALRDYGRSNHLSIDQAASVMLSGGCIEQVR